MKRILGVLLVTVPILVIGVNGQRKTISAAAFRSAVDIASKNSAVLPKRHKITEEFFEGGERTRTKSLIWEAASSDRTSTIISENGGGQVYTQETIEIGDAIYERENGGDWTKKGWYFKHGLTERSTVLLDSLEYCQDEAIIDGTKVKVLTESLKTTEADVLGYKQERYWIGRNGRILKIETTYGRLNPRNITRKKIFIYDYDSNIKIEAPIK